MRKLSFERITKQLEKAKAKFGKYAKVFLVLGFVLLIAILVYWLIFKHLPFMNPPPKPEPSPAPAPYEEPIDISQASPGAKGSTISAKNRKCCYNMRSGAYVARPPSILCMEFEFGKRLDDINRMLNALGEGTGVTLQGTAGKREFNGYVSSVVGKESLSKYAIYLYSDDTINYGYDPSYIYRSTECTFDLKQKITEVLDPIRQTL